jgi:hypothetical protein
MVAELLPRTYCTCKWFVIGLVPDMLPVEIAMQDEETMSIPAAGRKYYGLGKSASYDAADRGDIPTIRVGKKLRRVPKRAMEALMKAATKEALRRAVIRGTQMAVPAP